MALDLLGSLVVVVAASALAHHICLEQDRMSSFNFEFFFGRQENMNDCPEIMMRWWWVGKIQTERDKKATQSQRSDIMSNVCFVCYLCVSVHCFSSREETESPICIQPIHQVSLFNLWAILYFTYNFFWKTIKFLMLWNFKDLNEKGTNLLNSLFHWKVSAWTLVISLGWEN